MGCVGTSTSRPIIRKESREDTVQLKGKVTFAVPRNVQAAKKSKASEGEDETPKSNAEFREMFVKK